MPMMQPRPSATALLIARIDVLREAREWSQAELARRLYTLNPAWIQTRLNKMMNERQKFSVQDLDDLATVFGITVPELFFDEYGQWDRRSNFDRRKGDRRQQRQTIYDPKVEPTDEIGRHAFVVPAGPANRPR